MLETDPKCEVETTAAANEATPQNLEGETVDAKRDQMTEDAEMLTEQGGKALEEKDEDVETVDKDVGYEKMAKEENISEGHDLDGQQLEKLEGADDLKGEEHKSENEEQCHDEQEEEEKKVDKVEETTEMKDKECKVMKEKDEEKEGKGTKKKRSQGRRPRDKGEKEDEGSKSSKEVSTPTVFSTDRPIRERKTVVRLVEVIEKEQSGEGFYIEKGRGTPLRSIPNVAYKLSKRKPEDVKLLHMILFGRRGKAVDFKSHISQFSGFVWHEDEDKQRAKVVEKLDKCTMEQLLDLSDIFDMPISISTAKKEDLVVSLLDFMLAPYATTDIVLSEKEQHSTSTRKQKRSSKESALSSPGSAKHLKKKIDEDFPLSKEGTAKTDNGDEGKEATEKSENDIQDDAMHSKSEKEDDSNEIIDSVKKDKKLKKGKENAKNSARKSTSPKKASKPAIEYSPDNTSSKHSKDEEINGSGKKVFSRRKEGGEATKRKASTKSESRAKDSGKKMGKRKIKSEEKKDYGPSNEELKKMICEILEIVDFNTATFTDILKQLARCFKDDLTPRKEDIKRLIETELIKIAEAELQEEEDEEEGEDVDGKDKQSQLIVKELQTWPPIDT